MDDYKRPSLGQGSERESDLRLARARRTDDQPLLVLKHGFHCVKLALEASILLHVIELHREIELGHRRARPLVVVRDRIRHEVPSAARELVETLGNNSPVAHAKIPLIFKKGW